jgi:hypothetical protein
MLRAKHSTTPMSAYAERLVRSVKGECLDHLILFSEDQLRYVVSEYLLATHGSCCVGAHSTYNIRAGRARKVIGPFLHHMGIDMLEGGSVFGETLASDSGWITITAVCTAV